MGFYPPDSLIHEAQRRELTILPPDVQPQRRRVHRHTEPGRSAWASTTSRAYTPKTSNGSSHPGSRAAVHRLERTSPHARARAPTPWKRSRWSAACDQLAGGGPSRPPHGVVAARDRDTRACRTKGGDQLALELPLARAPDLPALSEWDAMIANYQATGISIDRHPLALLREQLTADGALTTADLADVRHDTHVKVGGFVIARQKPQTANGITFLLIEDEHGTLNVIVPQKLYEQHRAIVRTEPIIRVDGILERHADGGGAINLLAKEIGRLTPNVGAATANVREIRPAEEPPTTTAEDFAVAAPAVMNFGRGRGR